MKKSLAAIFILLCSIYLNAQKTIEKNIDFGGQYIKVDVPFASHIDVKTWDKPTVYFKAEISIIEPGYLELYQLNVDKSASNIVIKSDTDAVFDAFRKGWEEKKLSKKKYYYTSDMYDFNYVLYVPKNVSFKLKSINGDMKSEIIVGDFEAELINGDIDIKQYQGNLDLSTINGEIDLKVDNANLVAETIHGSIFADERLNLTSEDRHVGQKVEKRLSNASNKLKLNTINGNMYLRM